MAPPAAFRGGGHQGFDAALGKRRNLIAVGIAVVGQDRSGQSQLGGDRLDVRHQLTPVAGAVTDPGAQDQLRAPGIHHGLSIIGLAVFVMLALAHQPAVRVAQVALLIGTRPLIGRLRALALGPALALLARRHLGFVVRPLRLGAHLGLGLQTTPRRRQLIAQRRLAREFLRQALRILLATAVRCLSAGHQRRDLQLQLCRQLTGAIVSHRAVLAPIGVNLRPVNAHNTNLHKLQLLGQQQNLQETLGNRREVLAPKVAIVSWSGWTLAATKRTPISRCVARSIRRLEKIPLA